MMSQIQLPNVAFIESGTILWCLQAQRTQPPPEEEEEAEEEESEELGHADTYAEYKPSKCRLLHQINPFNFQIFTRIDLVINLSYTHCDTMTSEILICSFFLQPI